MQLVEWNDYLRTGIDIIDHQHKGLVDLANEIARRFEAGTPLSALELRALVTYLTEYAEIHFSTEEALMSLSGLDEAHTSAHHQGHARFLERVGEMMDRVDRDAAADPAPLIEFLGEWLMRHILGDDRTMARQVQARAASKRGARMGDERPPAPADPAVMAVSQAMLQLRASLPRNMASLPDPARLPDTASPLMELIDTRRAELGASEAAFWGRFGQVGSPALVMTLDQDLLPALLTDANPAACALLGYSREEMLNLRWRDLVTRDEAMRFPLLITELLVTGRVDCEITHVTRDGRCFIARTSLTHLVLRGRLATMTVLERAPDVKHQGGLEQRASDQRSRLRQARSHYLAGRFPDVERPRTAVLGLPRVHERRIDIDLATAFLRQHPLFRDLGEDHLTRLAAGSRLKRLHKGGILFQKGDAPRGLFLVMNGQMKLAVSSARGNEKVVEIVSQNDSLGDAEVIMKRPYPVFAQALGDVTLLQLESMDVHAVLDADPAFARRWMEHLSRRTHAMVRDVESYTLHSATERVVAYLLQHAYVNARGHVEVTLHAQKQVIASLLHLTPPTLSRIFQSLSDDGVIRVRGRRVLVPDAERLASLRPDASA
ncbi:bacteriohemerythrin [Nitrogeniibacter mangrovi]|uniref:Bacteriohemerythrin n=1 Tax=Nitrogeniibacter mangrovi TaxID=2016596 RepID=A0A6C1B5U8_9RHOO|nr:bacteriohemerythrin [Nitrogeniibacter mangrovi]QID18419.1 bacteriohemerythrin [Nitrogeniibacter mangrovi]